DRGRANDKIEWITNAVVDEVLGDDRVTGIRLRDVNTEETWEIEADGIFAAIGHDPNTALFLDQLDHDEAGYLITKPGSTETNIPGVFAVGDVQDHVYRQAVTAAGSGCMGALDAERYLAALEGHPGTAAIVGRADTQPTPGSHHPTVSLRSARGRRAAVDRPRRPDGGRASAAAPAASPPGRDGATPRAACPRRRSAAADRLARRLRRRRAARRRRRARTKPRLLPGGRL